MKILVCLLFKNSALWIDRFFESVESLVENNPNNVVYHLNIIYGDSNDGTDTIIKEKISELVKKYKHKGIVINMFMLPLPSRLDRLEKLAILRNTCIGMSNINQYNYVLMVDTDIIFDSYVIGKLINNLELRKDIGVIAPMVMIKNFRHFKDNYFYDSFAFRISGKMLEHSAPYIPDNVILPKNIKPNSLLKTKIVELDSVGSIYVVRADIYSKYDIKYLTEKVDNTEHILNGEYESEQVVFCRDVEKLTGYKIAVDPSIKVFHINLEEYGIEWH